MNKIYFSKYDIKNHIKQNKSIYALLVAFIALGIVIGLLFSLFSDGYLSLLFSGEKNLYSFINGSINCFEHIIKKILTYCVPLVLIFLFGLNYYSSFFCYIFIAYQSALFFMTTFALVAVYGLAGLINVIFITIPFTALYFIGLLYFSCVVINRCIESREYKQFNYRLFDNDFLLKIFISFAYVILLCVLFVFAYSIFLKNTTFVMF